MGQKYTQNGSLVNGNMDIQTCGPIPGGLILTHTHLRGHGFKAHDGRCLRDWPAWRPPFASHGQVQIKSPGADKRLVFFVSGQKAHQISGTGWEGLSAKAFEGGDGEALSRVPGVLYHWHVCLLFACART